MELLEQVREIYSQYDAALQAARAKAKPADGLFGFGTKLSDNRCNEDFSDQLEKTLAQAAAQGVSEAQACDTVQYICHAAEEHRKDEVAYWLMLAVQQYAQLLLPAMTQPQAKALCDWYRKAYPVQERLPVQQTFFAALCARAGESPRKKPFWKR